MSVFRSNLQAVRRRVAAAANAAGRSPDGVRLVAVSKTFDADAVGELLAAGQHDFGESYLQEAVPKMTLVNAACQKAGAKAPIWHMIGPLQSNKTRLVAEHFDWVHSVDRAKIAQRLAEQRPELLAPLNVCIQVNISGEATKSGVSLEELPELARAVAHLPRIRLVGLMAIPAKNDATAYARMAALLALRELQALDLRELSMGMSDDLEAAIAAGATMVRVGTALFGARIRDAQVPDSHPLES
jgi:pyridoxal phosphate enzyme (YggS family)